MHAHSGFGHLAMMTRDVYAASAELEAAGVHFRKRPDEGRMKGIAFLLDPDGYWIELVRRNASSPVTNKYTLAQTMIRVKDAEASLGFYRDLLGMTLLKEKHFGPDAGDFSLYFLAHTEAVEGEDGDETMRNMFGPVLELTHNHGTERQDDFR